MDLSDALTDKEMFNGKLQMPIEVLSQPFMLMLTIFYQVDKKVQSEFGQDPIENY